MRVSIGRRGSNSVAVAGLRLTFMSRSGEEEPLPLMALGEVAHVNTHNTREARRRRRGRSACAERPRLPRAGPHRTTRAPTATGCLISHYNLRAARFLPLLLPRFVLRIIECIPLAPAAMRGERRPDNSRVQLRRGRAPPYRGRRACYSLRADVTSSAI